MLVLFFFCIYVYEHDSSYRLFFLWLFAYWSHLVAQVVDLLTDAAKRLGADVQKLRKSSAKDGG